MKKLHFSTLIQAPRHPCKVWDTLIGAETYRDWTSVFSEGSYFAGSWNTGDRIQFLAPSGDGMSAVIAENRMHEFISIKHIGVIASGVEDTTSERVRAWTPAFENFTFTAVGADTELTVDLDIPEALQQYMLDTYPKSGAGEAQEALRIVNSRVDDARLTLRNYISLRQFGARRTTIYLSCTSGRR